MAQFHVTLSHGDEVIITAEAVDNVPEFVSELKKRGFVAGHKKDGNSIALIDPHVAIVRLM